MIENSNIKRLSVYNLKNHQPLHPSEPHALLTLADL